LNDYLRPRDWLAELAMNELRLLADNARWIVVDKPAGIAAIPARDEDPAESLRHRLQDQLGVALWVVHRIDRDTSGVIVYARDAQAHRALNLAFQRAQVGKTYLAWTAGIPKPERGRIDVALHSARKGKMRPALPGESDAKSACTDYQVEQHYQYAAMPIARVRCQPRSGRQHQLRVHLRSRECPILHDDLYGLATLKAPYDQLPIRRLALHAAAIELPAVIDVPAQRVEAALPGICTLKHYCARAPGATSVQARAERRLTTAASAQTPTTRAVNASGWRLKITENFALGDCWRNGKPTAKSAHNTQPNAMKPIPGCVPSRAGSYRHRGRNARHRPSPSAKSAPPSARQSAPKWANQYMRIGPHRKPTRETIRNSDAALR
jgi:23S rRNA-/tRNA-specific pseudouridylate synthase